MKNIYNRMDPEHYDEDQEVVEEQGDLLAEEIEERRKDSVIEREIRSIEEVF